MSVVESDVSKNTIKNTYVKTIRNLVLMGQGILIAPLVVSVLGLQGAGVWFLITQFSAYIQLLEFGIPTGLTRLYSNYKVLNDSENKKNVVSVSLLLLVCISFVLVLFSNEVSTLFFGIFTSIESNSSVEMAVRVAIIVTSLSLPLRCGIGLLEANHLFYVHLWIEIFFIFFRITTLFIFYLLDLLDISWLALIYFSSSFLIVLVQFLFSIKNKLVCVSFQKTNYSFVSVKKILSVGASVMILTASAITLRQGSPMILGIFYGTESVTLFSITMLLVSTLMQFITIPVSFIGPQASQLNAAKQKEKLYELFVLYSKYSIMITMVGLVTFYSIGQFLLKVWLGLDANSIQQIYLLTLMLLVSFALSVPALYARTVLSFVDKHWVTSLAEVSVVFIGLLVGFINIQIYDLGMIGMAIGISLVFLLRGIGPILFLITRYFGIRKIKYMVDIYSKNIMTIFLVLVAIMSLNIFHDAISNDVIETFILMIIVLVLQWFIVIDSKDKEKIKSRVACYFSK